jgi:hypothetical protein
LPIDWTLCVQGNRLLLHRPDQIEQGRSIQQFEVLAIVISETPGLGGESARSYDDAPVSPATDDHTGEN